MYELIKELKENKNDTIRIDYIIKKLENISAYEEFLKNEIDFNIETLMNDENIEEEQIEKLMHLSSKDIDDIMENVEKVNYIWEELSENIQYFINKCIY